MTGNASVFFHLPCDCARKFILNLKSHGFVVPGFGLWTDGGQDAAILQGFSRLTDKAGKPLRTLLVQLAYCPFCGLSARQSIIVKQGGEDDQGELSPSRN